MTTYLSHPRIVPDTVEERRYQARMAEGCLKQDSLIILPTGLGKTVIALIVAADVLGKGRKVMILAPTKPLVDQHSLTFSRWLRDTEICTLNGNMAPDRRTECLRSSDMVISTPQAVANDLENGRYDLRDFGLVIYDEAHRGVGNYAYVIIARYNTSAISMGMTASPGSDRMKVMEMCQNLCFTRIDMRDEYDPDVSPYIYETDVERIELRIPSELREISNCLKTLLDEYALELTRMGFMSPSRPASTGYMLQIGRELQTRIRNNERTTYVYRGMIVQSICIKILHAMGLVESQGMTPFRKYIMSLKEEVRGDGASKSSAELLRKERFIEAVNRSARSKVEHPKISKAMSLVSQMISEHPESKVMVFAQYRDMCELLVQKLSGLTGAKVEKLIGQSNGGMKQKEQIELLSRFRNGDSNIIVSTSVGEEGLDVSSTDLVVFYEPVPSEIRTIQRRGRTGRKNDGRVCVLVAKDTIDEAFDNVSAKKEENMRAMMNKLNIELARVVRKPTVRGQCTISDF